MTPMEIALAEARAAAARGEVPVGAVVLDGAGAVLARAGNEVEARHDASAHAETAGVARGGGGARRGAVAGLRAGGDAGAVPDVRPGGSFFRIRRLTFGAYDPKGGGVEHGARVFDAPSCHHRPEVVGGVRESEAGVLLREFFAARRGPANCDGIVPPRT